MNITYFIIIINNNYINMYKYNKNDNMIKELVWSNGQCFSLVTGKVWVWILATGLGKCNKFKGVWGLKPYTFSNEEILVVIYYLCSKFVASNVGWKILIILIKFRYVFKSKNLGSKFRK